MGLLPVNNSGGAVSDGKNINSSGDAISAVRANLQKKEELSKIEIKLRKKLTLINGQLSEKGGIKFLKNRSMQHLISGQRNT